MKKLFKKICSWFKPNLIRCVGYYDEYYNGWEVVYGYSIEECNKKIKLGLFEYEENFGIDVGLMPDSICDHHYLYTIVEDKPGLYKSIEELMYENY